MIDQWNEVIGFLADEEPVADSYDLAILAGNSLPYLADEFAKMYHEKRAKHFMLVGGIGHATVHLQNNFKKKSFSFGAISETQMYLDYLEAKYAIPQTAFLTEHHSTNSGENAAFSLKVVTATGLSIENVLLLEDPLLQKRIKATFEKEWLGTKVIFTNDVPAIPYLKSVGTELVFEEDCFAGLWEKDYFFSLVLGEMLRLQNNEKGYGPRGTNYIGAVEIPDAVNQAYQELLKVYPYDNQRK